MLANRISYLGAAYSVLVMLLIIMDVRQFRRTKFQTYTLFAISTTAFLLAASGSMLGLYYKSVSIETINGMTRLVKDYGPLHILYPVYLFSYFAMMIGVIHRSTKRKPLASPKYAIFLTVVVLLNIGVWTVEQIIDVHFEFLSVSYVVTEVLLLLIYIEGHETAEIPDLAFVSIHTVKKHNRSIYQKLEVASRDELMLYIELFRCCGRLPELTYSETE